MGVFDEETAHRVGEVAEGKIGRTSGGAYYEKPEKISR